MGGEEDLVAGLASPYNTGGMVMRKRSGTSHAQKNSFKGNGMNQMHDEMGMSPLNMQADKDNFQSKPKVKGKLVRVYIK